jgi:SAM-dependent methyltransferase
MSYEKSVNSFFNKKYTQHKKSVLSLGWGSVPSQEARFSIFAEYIKDNNSLLDVGCGFADLYFYLKNNNINTKYKGIDFNKNFIKEIDNNLNTECLDLFDISASYDWVVGSGIFCYPHNEWEKYFLNTLNKMYSLSNKGCIVNFLYDIDDPLMVQTDIPSVYNIVKNITNKLIFRQDYKPNDFSLILKK